MFPAFFEDMSYQTLPPLCSLQCSNGTAGIRFCFGQRKYWFCQIKPGDAIVAFVNGSYHLEQSLPFPTTVYCRFHEEDKVLIAETQLMLTLTLTLALIQTKINSKRRNKFNIKKILPCFEPVTVTILVLYSTTTPAT